MLETLITSKTRVKLLMKFFLNYHNISYLRDLASEFGESTNAIRLELNKMEEAGLLLATHKGNKKLFKANAKTPAVRRHPRTAFAPYRYRPHRGKKW